MRLSIREDDPGYDPRAIKDCKAFVDGVEVTERCHTADEEEGKVWCFKHNEIGQPFIDQATGKTAEEILIGKVIILVGKGINGNDPRSSH